MSHQFYLFISGVITVRDSLKCETKDSCLTCLKEDKVCSLVIVATDRGQPRQSAQTVVKVALLDTNDHDPKISFKVLPDQSQSFATVNEVAKVGTSVAAITVTDADKGKMLTKFKYIYPQKYAFTVVALRLRTVIK